MKKYIFRCVIQALVAVILLTNLVQVKAQAEDANYFNSVGDDSDYSEFIYSFTSIPPTYIPVPSTESNAIDAVTSPDPDLNGIDSTTGNDQSSSADVDQYTSTGSNVWRGGTTTVQRERENSPTVLAHTTRQAPQITSTHIEEQTTIISTQPANLTTSHITRNTTKIVYTTTVSTIKLIPEVKTQTTVRNEPNITSSTSNTVSYRGGFASTPPNNEGVWNVDNFPFDFDFGPADIDTTPDTTTQGDIVFIIHAPFSAFFDANWRWFLIGVIVVLLIFILPGMIIQVYCNKFYHSYKREKHGDLELGTVVTATGTMDAPVLPSVATSNNETCSTVGGEHEKIEPPFEPLQTNDVIKSDVIPNMTEPKHYDDAPQNDVYSTIQSKTHQHDSRPNHNSTYERPIRPLPVPITCPAATPQHTKSAIGNETIINSNGTSILDPITSPRVKNALQPQRPTKPKEYRIAPMKHKDVKRREANDKRRGVKETTRRTREKPTRRENERKRQNRMDSDPRDLANKRKELKRKEELLRQIIAGVTEAEMLQRKLDRTRKWAKEQRRHDRDDVGGKARDVDSKARRREHARSGDDVRNDKKNTRHPYNTERTRKPRN